MDVAECLEPYAAVFCEAQATASRLSLIHEIMAKVTAETETLRTEDHLGADLAYLFAAIADSTGGHVEWDIAHGGLHGITHHLFVDWFAPDHPVWRFIRIT